MRPRWHRRLAALALLVVLVLGTGACTTDTEWESGEPQIVAGTPEEQRIIDRRDKAGTAAASMAFVLILVGPMALVAVALAVVHRNDT